MLSTSKLENALDYSSHIVLIGDLNEDLLSVNRHHLHDLMTRKCLRNVITDPTRVTPSSSTLLDPIVFSEECHFTEALVIEFQAQISDHNGVFVSLSNCVNNKKCYIRQVWLYKQGTMTS